MNAVKERRGPSTPQELHFVKSLLRSEFVTLLKIRDFFARKLFVFSGEIFAKSKKSQPLRMTTLGRPGKRRGRD